MNKTIVILLALLFLAFAGNAPSKLMFQFGNSLATLVGNGSRYNGVVAVQSVGGNGGYKYSLSGLPNGWSASGNIISIPNIVNIVGEYVIRAKVTDSTGAVLEGDIKLIINGVNVLIQSSNANTDNNIQFSFGAGAPIAVPSPGASTGPDSNRDPGKNGLGSVPESSPASVLYDSYPGLPAGSGPSPPRDGRYPTVPIPAGPPSLPNIVPAVIASAQAPFNPLRDSRPITIDEVKRNAAFNRQLNANKGVANLIAIIQQLTANVNAGNNDVKILQNQFKDADYANNDCNGKIYDLSNTRTKIQNAIKDRQEKITDANRQINDLAPSIKDLINTRDNLINKRNQIQNSRSPNTARLSDLQRQFKDCTGGRQKLQRQVDNINSQIDAVSNDIKKIQDDVNSAPTSIDLINQQIPIVESKIDDLKKQLESALKQKSKLLQDKDNYQRVVSDSTRRVGDLQSQLKSLREKLPDLQSQLSDSELNCGSIQKQIDDFRNQLSQKQADYKIIAEQISAQDTVIRNKNQESKKISGSVSNLPGQISTLQQELARVQESIRRQYFICNDAADAVKAAKQNLDAMNNKIFTQSGWLREANINLQKARNQKQLADLAVQQIISASSSNLPYAFAPNGNAQSPVGTPAGNNPSGNPLGPVLERNQVVPGSPIVVGDLSTYLSQAYGAGVDPARPSTVTTLYPLSSLTIQALTGQSITGVFNQDGTFVSGGPSGPFVVPQFSGPGASLEIANGPNGGGKILATFSCNGQNGLTQGEGRVLSVQPGRIIIAQPNDNQLILNVGGCTMINSIKKDYVLIPQAKVWFKGIDIGANQVNLQQMTCI